MSENKNEKNLLPETEYRAWDKELVALRDETHKAMLCFNTSGDKQVLKELFNNRWKMSVLPRRCTATMAAIISASGIVYSSMPIVPFSPQAAWKLAMMYISDRT